MLAACRRRASSAASLLKRSRTLGSQSTSQCSLKFVPTSSYSSAICKRQPEGTLLPTTSSITSYEAFVLSFPGLAAGIGRTNRYFASRSVARLASDTVFTGPVYRRRTLSLVAGSETHWFMTPSSGTSGSCHPQLGTSEGIGYGGREYPFPWAAYPFRVGDCGRGSYSRPRLSSGKRWFWTAAAVTAVTLASGVSAVSCDGHSGPWDHTWRQRLAASKATVSGDADVPQVRSREGPEEQPQSECTPTMAGGDSMSETVDFRIETDDDDHHDDDDQEEVGSKLDQQASTLEWEEPDHRDKLYESQQELESMRRSSADSIGAGRTNVLERTSYYVNGANVDELSGGVSAGERTARMIEGGGKVGKDKGVAIERPTLFTSAQAAKGHRPYMEDEFFLSNDGTFSAVYDGHGGQLVSKYLRQNLYKQVLESLPPGADDCDLPTMESAIQAAFKSVDDYVVTQDTFNRQGSTAVAVVVHTDQQGKGSIISANVGDSRAVLSRRGEALNLTEDHKPNHPKELERIKSHNGKVHWFGFVDPDGGPIDGTGVYRVNGNLAVARAIGDVDQRPCVSGECELRTIDLNKETDQFVILATDGLWDVMSSEEAVQYVHTVMGGAMGAMREGDRPYGRGTGGDRRAHMTLSDWTQRYADDRGMIRAANVLRKKKMARYLTEEAIRRGSMDNTTVVIVWLQ